MLPSANKNLHCRGLPSTFECWWGNLHTIQPLVLGALVTCEFFLFLERGKGGSFKSRLQYSKQKWQGLKWLYFHFQCILILIGEGESEIRHGSDRWLCCCVMLQSFLPCGRDHHSPRSQRISWIFQFWAGWVRRFLRAGVRSGVEFSCSCNTLWYTERDRIRKRECETLCF